ncbi:hypothetical protein I4U23_012766 [Adineta vaga]|nr:hypothetical protein I4U23_012766 [Adineta vaga]
MRAIDRFYNQEDEFMHPLWIGILLLLSIIIIIGLFCCIRIKCHSQLRILRDRLFRRNTAKKNARQSTVEKYSATYYSYNWPSIYGSTKHQSPKLYTLVKNLRTISGEKQAPIKQENDQQTTTEMKQMQKTTLGSVSPAIVNEHTSEVARKFYASMRRTSQCGNSSSMDSYTDDASLSITIPATAVDHSLNSKRDENTTLFRTACFFQSIPDTSLA